jgi:hypothetical protein
MTSTTARPCTRSTSKRGWNQRGPAMPSTVIRSYRYDPARCQLAVVFQSGRRYVYEDVPNEVFESMKRAFSKGEFFNNHVRDQYRFVRTSGDA